MLLELIMKRCLNVVSETEEEEGTANGARGMEEEGMTVPLQWTKKDKQYL